MKFKGSKLNLTAAALLLACGSVHAQSSVTLFGAVDTAILYASQTAGPGGTSTGRLFGLQDAGLIPSFFGLTGREDLGGGLSAIFKLQSGISTTNGGFNSSNGNFWGQQAYVGLEGKQGTLKLGVQPSPLFLSMLDLDPRHFTDLGSALLIYAGNVAFTGLANSNAISYTSPKLAGFEGSAMYALGGVAGNFQAGKQWSGSLKYDNGSLLIEAAIYNGNSGGVVTPIPSSIEFIGKTLGIGYRFGSLTAKASFASFKVAGSFSNNIYSGGLDYFVRPDLNVSAGIYWTMDRNDSSNNSVMGSVGAQYFLSKRTSLYGQFGVVDNRGEMNTGIATYPGLVNGPHGTTFAANLGVRHSF